MQIRDTSWALNSTTVHHFIHYNNVFTNDECKRIIALLNTDLVTKIKRGTIGHDQSGNSPIRQSNISFLYSDKEENAWIFRRLVDLIQSVNNNYFKYELLQIEVLQLSEYAQEYSGHYDTHFDIQNTSGGYNIRKLQFSVQLQQEDEYSGGDLVIYPSMLEESYINKQVGTVCFFPSYVPHKVTKVTSGTRYSLVGWVVGPPFK